MEGLQCGWVPSQWRKKAAIALIARLSLKSRLLHGPVKGAMLTFYVQIANHLLDTSATEYKAAEANSKIVSFTQLAKISSLQYVSDLWMETLRCPQVYDEWILRAPFVEGSPYSIWHTMPFFLSSNKYAVLQKLAYEATSLAMQQEAALGLDTSEFYRSLSMQIRPHQVISRIEDEVTLRQYRSQNSGRQTKNHRGIWREMAIANTHG